MVGSKYQQAKTVIDYHINRKQSLIAKMQSKHELTQKDKIRIGEELDLIQAIRTLQESVEIEIGRHMGKLPPQAIDLEESILGALMLENGKTGFNYSSVERVIKIMKPGHFHSQPNSVLFDAIQRMFTTGLSVDIRTVHHFLKKEGKIDLLPHGPYYIAEISSKVSSAANIEYHAGIVIEQAIKRELIFFCGRLLNDSYEDTTDCFQLIEGAKQELVKIETLNVTK